MKRTWFIGIDISKRTLDVSIYDPKSKKSRKHFKVSNNNKGFKQLVKELKTDEVKLDEAFICLEYCGVYGLDIGLFLEGKIKFCFCNALHIKRSLGLTRGKNDKLDAHNISRFSYLFRDELAPTSMPTKTLLSLKHLMSERSRVTKAIVVEKQVIKELKKHIGDTALKRTKNRLISLKADIKAIENEIITLIMSEVEIATNYKLLTSIIGISLVNGVMMILCTNNFEGITDPRSFACYCGVAPFEYSSGTSIRGKTRVSHYANKKMKTHLTNAARSAVTHDPEIRLYYQRKKEQGKAHGTIMNAIKFKLITRSFAVVKRRTPFVKLRQAG